MEPKNPVNIWPLHPEKYIKEHGLIEVTSYLTWEPSSSNLHPDGLFSEGIFGQLGSPERLSTMGFISLNTPILSPLAYKNVNDLKGLYVRIMSGQQYAIFDEKLKDFLPCDKTEVGCDTGYTFFLSRFNDLKFAHNKSELRSQKILTIEKMKEMDAAIVRQVLVLPAGIRDIKQTGDRFEVEEINKVYTSILSLASEVKQSTSNPLLDKVYDGVRYNIQLKVYELFLTHKNFFDGKTGYGQRRYARRGLAWGTRNVITAANMSAESVDDQTFLKQNETLVPVFQAAKAFQPAVISQLRELFYSQIFSMGVTRVAGIDTKTFNIEYIDVTDTEVTKALSSAGLEELIVMFQNVHMREKPVIIRDVNNKFYYLFLVYDNNNEIYVLRNVNDFSTFMKENKNHEVDTSKIRPLTYVEMMYFATYKAVLGRHVTVTRYPAIEIGSIYPSKVKIGTTVPSKKVKFTSQYQEDYSIELPHYPIVGNSYIDSVVIHTSQNKGLDADYDGDTISINSVLSVEANEEQTKYLHSIESIISPSGKFLKSAYTSLTNLTLTNLTRDPLT